MYTTIRSFYDLQDDNRMYRPGDTYPRDGLTVTDSRIEELASDRNRLGMPVIKLVEEDPVEKPKARKRVKKDA
jgi:hypothetical protein